MFYPECFEEIDDPEHDIDPRLFHELSAAIRRGDRVEAELLLDRLAEEVGPEYTESVQLGRFSRLAA